MDLKKAHQPECTAYILGQGPFVTWLEEIFCVVNSD